MESYEFEKFYQKTWFVLLVSFTALVVAGVIVFFVYKAMIKSTTPDPNPLAEETHEEYEEYLKEREKYENEIESIEKEYEEVLEDWDHIKEYLDLE